MGSHNSTTEIYDQYRQLGDQVIADPGAGGTFDLRGRWGAKATIASGTRKLPDSVPECVVFYVIATGSVTLTNVAGTTVATLASGEVAGCVPSSSTEWAATIFTPGAIEINTAADLPVADAPSYTANTNVETTLMELLAHTERTAGTSISTAGNGTLTAASLAGSNIVRTGPSSAFTDTTATAADIITALGSGIEAADGLLWRLVIRNTVAYPQTISAGSGVQLSGLTVVPPNSAGHFLLSYDTADEVNLIGLGIMGQTYLPDAQFNTSAAASPVTVAAGVLTGARTCYWQNTTNGAVTVNTRSAANMFSDTPGAHVGLTWTITIASRGDNTVTLAGGTGVTITGTATVATGTTKSFHCTFTTSSAATITAV